MLRVRERPKILVPITLLLPLHMNARSPVKAKTVAADFMGLEPIIWSLGTGPDMMKRVFAPIVGGLHARFILEPVVCPPVHEIWKWRFGLKQETVDPAAIPVPERPGH